MKKIIYAFLFIFIAGFSTLNAQYCGFDHIMDQSLQNPLLAKNILQSENQIQDFIRSGRANTTISPNGTPLYIIPVVVHVIHTGGAVGSIYNPTDLQITQTIDYVNKVWDGTAPGFTGGVGDMQVEFRLAKRDPNCNPTNGIVRVDGSSVSGYTTNGVRVESTGVNEIDIKNLSRWNTANYYNIWIINKIDAKDGTTGQFIGGFAYYPGASSNLDGAMMLATKFITGNKTLPHELGHAFFLYHPFEGSTSAAQCPPNADCTINGDRVCDTDPVSQNVTGGVYDFTCRTGPNPCGNAYSPNTESNVMGYTNCFTLFTAGQKARVIAAMSLPSRATLPTSLGATPTNEGTTVCPPKINFKQAEMTVSEANGGTMDCRKYTDYVGQLTINSNPSVTATATLINAGGTATNGQDYILTTNGNFITPSLELSFPAGSSDPRSFTLRVFDDGYIEPTENLILGFSVNSNGGTAVKGDGIIVMQINITDNDVEPAPVIQIVDVIGTLSSYLGNSSTGSNPLDNKLAMKKNIWNIKASELIAKGFSAGNITGMALYIQKNGGRPFTNFQIKMGTTTREYIVDGGLYGVSTNTTCVSLATFTTVNEWNIIPFTTPFVWDGVNNLVIQLCYNNGSGSADPSDVTVGYSDGGSSSQGNMYWNNTLDCAGVFASASYYQNGVKPTTGIFMDKPGAVTESVLNASNTGYLGPNGEMYFYSASGKVLGKIKNLTNWDYGCTEVKIDRTGTGTKAFFNNNAGEGISDKTIVVLPTNNNPAGQYEITLYYKKTEVDGFKGATGINWANAGIVKTVNPISSYTPGAVPLADATMGTSFVRGFYGEDSTLKATFSGGFSGFGVINAANILPVTWLSFNGKMEQGNAQLTWATANETRNNRFDIELSRNGSDFSSIGSVPSSGSGTQVRTYGFTHFKPLPGTNFYRIKQIDNDGKFNYSQVIGLRGEAIGTPPAAYPNPATTTVMLDWGNLAGKSANWELLSADMKAVKRGSAAATSSLQSISLSGMASGVYYIRIISEKEVSVLRIIKQ